MAPGFQLISLETTIPLMGLRYLASLRWSCMILPSIKKGSSCLLASAITPLVIFRDVFFLTKHFLGAIGGAARRGDRLARAL